MTPIKRKQDYEQIISKISYNAIAQSKGLKIEYNSPVKVSYNYKENNFAISEDDFFYFIEKSCDFRYELNEEVSERKYPYESLENKKIIENIVIEIPLGYKVVLMPENLDIDNEFFALKRNIEIENNNIIINAEIEQKPFITDVKGYESLYNTIMQLLHIKNNLYLFKKK